jgi:hypothetical protein
LKSERSNDQIQTNRNEAFNRVVQLESTSNHIPDLYDATGQNDHDERRLSRAAFRDGNRSTKSYRETTRISSAAAKDHQLQTLPTHGNSRRPLELSMKRSPVEVTIAHSVALPTTLTTWPGKRSIHLTLLS